MNEEHYVNLEFYVAGVKFHQYKDAEELLEQTMELDLVPEPDNKYDSDAVKVMCEECMLGYVPAKTGQAKRIAEALRAGIKLQAIITKNDPDAEKDHRKLKIWVREEETTSDEKEL